MQEIKVHGGLGGAVWFIGWLFTIGYLKLATGPAILAIVLWPYDIGVALSALHH